MTNIKQESWEVKKDLLIRWLNEMDIWHITRGYNPYERKGIASRQVLEDLLTETRQAAAAEERDQIARSLEQLPSYSGAKTSEYDQGVYDAIISVRSRQPNQ